MPQHRWAEVIRAWASGEPIQYRYGDAWFDVDNEDGFEKDSPNFNIKNIEWRIKSAVITRKYRVALFRDPRRFFYTLTDDDYTNTENFEAAEGFVKWLTDWIEYEIEK